MRRPLAVALLAGVVLLLAAPAASAHALLRSSDPSSGASLGKAPEKVTLTFTEPPDLTLSTVHVLDSTGRAVESGRAKGVPGKPLVLEVPLGQLPNGAYTVSWRTVSRADGHLTNGSFAFGVGVQAPSATSGGAPAAATSPSPSVLGVAGRWAFDWGLILLVGAVASSLLVFRRREDGPPLPLLGGALALAAAGLAAMIVAEHSRVGVAFGDLLGSPTGSKLINQAVVLAVTALVLGAVARWPRRPELLVLLGVAAAATMLVHVAGGHAAGEATLTPLNVLVQWAHLLAVGVWVGGFLWLLLGLRGAGAAGSGPEPGNGSQATMRPEPARASAGGQGQEERTSPAPVAGLIALGAVNRFRIVPALRAGRAKVATLGSTVRAELALAIPIVVAAAVLGELPPAQYVSQQAARQQAPAAVTVTGNDFATSVKVELTATPDTVSTNQFSAKVVDYDSGQPIPATRVSLSFTLPSRPDVGASALDLKKTPDGRWQGQGILSIAGRWSITALVQGPSGSVTVPLQLQPRAAEGTSPQVKISKAPGQPTVYTIALQRGSSLQAYLDPGKPGPNVLHLTYFAANGSEQPMFQVHATATNPAGATADLSLSRFSAGHLVSNLSLNAGRWSFSVVGTSKAGDLTDARFEQVIQ